MNADKALINNAPGKIRSLARNICGFLAFGMSVMFVPFELGIDAAPNFSCVKWQIVVYGDVGSRLTS